jgi:hypothetical protein
MPILTVPAAFTGGVDIRMAAAASAAAMIADGVLNVVLPSG